MFSHNAQKCSRAFYRNLNLGSGTFIVQSEIEGDLSVFYECDEMQHGSEEIFEVFPLKAYL
jgi:hypothetical protein